MNDIDIAVRSQPSESDFVSCVHVAKIRISTLLIRKWILSATSLDLPLCLLLHLWLSLSPSLSHSTCLSADVIVYLYVHGVREASATVSKLPLPHPLRLSTPQSLSDSHLIALPSCL